MSEWVEPAKGERPGLNPLLALIRDTRQKTPVSRARFKSAEPVPGLPQKGFPDTHPRSFEPWNSAPQGVTFWLASLANPPGALAINQGKKGVT